MIYLCLETVFADKITKKKHEKKTDFDLNWQPELTEL